MSETGNFARHCLLAALKATTMQLIITVCNFDLWYMTNIIIASYNGLINRALVFSVEPVRSTGAVPVNVPVKVILKGYFFDLTILK